MCRERRACAARRHCPPPRQRKRRSPTPCLGSAGRTSPTGHAPCLAPCQVAAVTPDLFTEYERGDFFDEVFDARGGIRSHYRPLLERLRALAPAELLHRAGLRDTILRNLGIT